MTRVIDIAEWDHVKQVGPAIHTPAVIKDIIINCYRIEWLDLSEAETNFYSKNHMVATVVFDKVESINNIDYSSARLSMELDDERKVAEFSVDPDVMSGDAYNPGVYTVTLLRYDEPSYRTPHYCNYPVRDGLTIGDLIDKIIARKMHHFLFLPYVLPNGSERWKGCGDHTLHCWAHFVREGDITSKDSFEYPDTPLCTELTYTYITGGAKTCELVGRGWWVSHKPLEDSLTPPTTFSDTHLIHPISFEASASE